MLAVAGDYVEKSLDFAQDSVKQLIALPTAIVTITVTFATDLVGVDGSLVILKWAWVAFVVSVIGGVVSLLAMTGSLGRAQRTDESGGSPDIYSGTTRTGALVQVLAFVVAIGLVVWFGIAEL